MENYKNGVDLDPLIRKLKGVDLSSKEPTAPTGTGKRAKKEKAKKIYDLELKIIWFGQIYWKTILQIFTP